MFDTKICYKWKSNWIKGRLSPPAKLCCGGSGPEGPGRWQQGEERDVVDRGQDHKCGMSHGQTELIYGWSGSTSAAWCRGSRMSGMGVRSGSRFSLSIISGIAGRQWLAGWIHEAFNCYRDRAERHGEITSDIKEEQMRLNDSKRTEPCREAVSVSFFKRIHLSSSPSICSSHDLLSSDIMETTAIFIGW